MDELRFVRREDQTLVVANDAGQEFTLVVDDAVLSELRSLSRRERDTGKVRPREIQSLIRAGKTRAEIMAQTGLEESDIERYEEPVLAERRYVLERAHAVPVRAEAHADADQRFGAVIQERLISLGADASEWASWRDEETGWMISLEFISHDVAHRAVWAFEHRKGALSPITPDAVNLSKQGEVGDRLIPKLRAVDSGDGSARFDSGAFDTVELAQPHEPADATRAESAQAEPEEEITPERAEADYERKREIDQRAIKTNETQPVDLSQTADLLDALRRRRGERDEANRAAALAEVVDAAHAPAPGAEEPSDTTAQLELPDPTPQPSEARARSIWGANGVSGSPAPAGSRGDGGKLAPAAPQTATPAPTAPPRLPAAPAVPTAPSSPTAGDAGEAPEAPEKLPKKGRASIPSWDDILFGTRSDEDPN
ncbi:septation protein SepH [Leucobacter luti]|uniref:DUF3071 family protein n=1 Tax=Leucobacter luti TaxID=340320 RepID=A0A4Q7TMC2_9MICO|nr:septation protein SepH [Leucobacter luti]MBL3700381.1 DUF3071 domain-containing protein [Leucobacter luti]RZT60552.1 DUF3071 family protein [Leucobacter luti]